MRRSLLILHLRCQQSKDVNRVVQVPISHVLAVVDACHAQTVVVILVSFAIFILLTDSFGGHFAAITLDTE
jgi:hypothetical protein